MFSIIGDHCQSNWTYIGSSSSSSSLILPSQNYSSNYICDILLQYPTPTIINSTIISVQNIFCSPLSIDCSSGAFIDSAIIIGEFSSQINNLATGCSSDGYNNQTVQSVITFENQNYTAQVSTSIKQCGIFITFWIDFNDNDQFENAERLGSAELNNQSLQNIDLSIYRLDTTVISGTDRMRVTLVSGQTPHGCGYAGAIGETHDYTVKIINRKYIQKKKQKIHCDLVFLFMSNL
jgi:hypothetical protein